MLFLVLFLAPPLIGPPVYTSSSTITYQCKFIGDFFDPTLPVYVIADSVAGCPANYSASLVSYTIAPLNVSAGFLGAPVGDSTYDIVSTGTDSAPAGIAFDLVWTWAAGDDDLAVESASASFAIDGLTKLR